MKSMKSSASSLLLRATLLVLFLQANGMTGQSQRQDKVENEIQEALRLETQYFYQRDISKWEGQWSHGPFVMKCYVRDGKYLEQMGWPVIQQSAKDYMKAHPKPEPVPTAMPEYKIEVFGKSALVSYIQLDPTQGRKREIRVMVKEKDQWKIAYMSTNYFTD
ncbi:hypothetical protein WIW50_04390 [Flavobacteriaceae bacterium 3-367]|uniref:hypothetical protein n=1 Tax=Eudoraea algarum TaxID=3417568 RepID=UPI0032717255